MISSCQRRRNIGEKYTRLNPRRTIHALTCGGACASHGNPDVCNDLVEFRLKAEESRWRWTKRTIWGYWESKCRGNLKTNQRMFIWRSNRERFWTYEPCLHIFGGKLPKMVQTFHFLSFLVFFYFLSCFYLTTTIYGTLHWRRLEQY